jgi:hypothetical protein
MSSPIKKKIKSFPLQSGQSTAIQRREKNKRLLAVRYETIKDICEQMSADTLDESGVELQFN